MSAWHGFCCTFSRLTIVSVEFINTSTYMEKNHVLQLNLTQEELERVNAAYVAYDRFSINNPDYSVPFEDCETEADVKADIKQRIKQRNQAQKAKTKRKAAEADKKAAMLIIQQAVDIALAKGKTATEIRDALLNL